MSKLIRFSIFLVILILVSLLFFAENVGRKYDEVQGFFGEFSSEPQENTSTSMSDIKEGLDVFPIATDPSTKYLLNGYYLVDNTRMAMIPYGYTLDPTDMKKIIPTTKFTQQALIPANGKYPPVPTRGDPLPDGFYLISDSSLAGLPPNMSPNVEGIAFSENPSMLRIYYKTGYVSQTQYYDTKYKPNNPPKILPEGVYFVDKERTTISFLSPNEVADKKKGYGKILNPQLGLSTTQFNFATSNYRDVSNNYDTQFHDDVKTIMKVNGMYDLEFGETRVKDKSGNVIILPKTNSQSNVTYYDPGEYPFGASKYVPNYEDSIYLSSVGKGTRIDNLLTGNITAISSKFGNVFSENGKSN
jgi:hypothetical protein